MCYDPVNKEIVHVGGDGGSTDVATWAFRIEENEWRRLEFGSAALRDLGARAKTLRWQAKALLGACCNRFAITEMAQEATADLAAQAAALVSEGEKLSVSIRGTGLKGPEQAAGEAAASRLAAAIAAIKALTAAGVLV